jgi:hypothetical protein
MQGISRVLVCLLWFYVQEFIYLNHHGFIIYGCWYSFLISWENVCYIKVHLQCPTLNTHDIQNHSRTRVYFGQVFRTEFK